MDGDRISLHKFSCLQHTFSLLRLIVEEETLSTSTHSWERREWVFCHDDLRPVSSKSSLFCTESMSGGWWQGWNVLDKEQDCLMDISTPTEPEANLAQPHLHLQNHSAPWNFLGVLGWLTGNRILYDWFKANIQQDKMSVAR